jgi:hypothetical protein
VANSGSERLKLHRRALALGGRTYTVLSPRSSSGFGFAMSSYPGAWHVVTDRAGAGLLGRLLWAMAFQRRERTIAVIDPGLMVPNPFDADPSVPIAILNEELGTLNRQAADDLQAQLPYSAAPAGTVVLQTRGLDAALAEGGQPERDGAPAVPDPPSEGETASGLVIISAPPPILRAWGVRVARLGLQFNENSDEAVLEWSGSAGEIQVLEDFEIRVVRAQEARERLFPDRPDEDLGDEERRRVWELTRGQ